MKFPTPLVKGTLVKRYKRFLADVEMEDGKTMTVSVPNTGSMRGLTDPGIAVWLSHSNSPTRKYSHRLELVEVGGQCVGVNTGLPNDIVGEAISCDLISDLGTYETVKREQKYGESSRIDLLLSDEGKPDVYVEVKNVHFSRAAGLAEFPDSPTARGVKHLNELANMVAQGHRAAMVFCIQRSDCSQLAICRDIDPAYGIAFDNAVQNGVEAYAIACNVTPVEIVATHCIPITDLKVA